MVPPENNGSNLVRSHKAHKLWLHQGGTTPQLGSQYRPCYQEKWEDLSLHWFLRSKWGMSKRWIPPSNHGCHDRQHVWVWTDVFHGWILRVQLYPDDEKHTSFRTPLGVYYYTVMPFRLKNAGATYQRAMNAIFHEHWLVANAAYLVSYFHTYYRIKLCIVLINCLIYLQAHSLRRWREMSPKPTKFWIKSELIRTQ